MAHSWIDLSGSGIGSGDLLKNKTSKLGDLKNNMKHIAELFSTDSRQLRSTDAAVTSGVVSNEEVIKLVQDLNALDFTQTCSGYNSTQWINVCSSNYGQYTNQGTDKAVDTNHSYNSSKDSH